MITVLDLAIYRGLKENENGSYTLGDIEETGLPGMGGCGRCGATVAAYNACPSTRGFIMCADGCIGDDGFETVEEANFELFPEEYRWVGPNNHKSV